MSSLSPSVRMALRVVLNCYRAVAVRVAWLHRLFTFQRGTRVEERVMSGRSWDEFCDSLKAAGAAVIAPGAPRDAFTQAEGYRYLSRLARAGLENFLECNDVECPRLCAIANGSRIARICIGSDNPDNLYENATIDGSLEYVVSGTRGTVGYLGFGTQSGQYGGKGGLQTVDYLEADQLVYDSAVGPPELRTFTIVLSASKPADAANWLRLKPDPREAMFILRQTFGNRTRETPANVSIALRSSSSSGGGAPTLPPPLTAAKLDAGLQAAGVLVAGASAMFAKWALDFQQHVNTLPLFDQTRSDQAGGDPNIRYYHSYWRLAPGQVLRIRVRPPPCRCWNFQLNNHYMESLDYRHHTIHTNSTLATADTDDPGGYTILVSSEDPNARGGARGGAAGERGGFRGNWLDTAGHTAGTMCFRYVAPEVSDALLPPPRCEVVAIDEC